MQHENVTQKVLLCSESILQNAKQLQDARLSWHPHIGLVLSENFSWAPPRSPGIMPLDFFLWRHVKDIVYKTPVTYLDELKLRTVAAIETVTPQMLENTSKEIEYRFDILCAKKGAHVEVV
jgi:hypothetical protein